MSLVRLPRLLRRRDHNATSYSTETLHLPILNRLLLTSRDHNATSYSTETFKDLLSPRILIRRDHNATSYSTETFSRLPQLMRRLLSRDHNATSYSTETRRQAPGRLSTPHAEIITLRAIALKRSGRAMDKRKAMQRS